ncbi:MAG: CDP-glycerol glycerophosphotransferase family protein [Promethearchaeota archaeon]
MDEKIIIFGMYSGRLYADNTKYLFEFLNEHSNNKVYWIAKNKEIITEIKKLNYKVVPYYSLQAIKLLRKAKYVFLTHGHLDFPPVKFSPETKIILTWHGTPIKRINDDLKKSLIYSKWTSFFKLDIRYNDYVDYLLTPTRDEFEHQILSSSFSIPKEKILDLGYPKLDILAKKNSISVENIRNKYEIPEKFERIILYCPTYRDDHSLRFPISEKELNNLEKLLQESNSLFLMKGHYFVQNIDFEQYENIKIAPKGSDIQELYFITNILITDYSSTMLDFSIFDRPILLFPYDLDEYKKVRGMYYNLEDIAPGPLLFNGSEIIEAIKNIDNIDKNYREKRAEIRDRFNKYLDGKSAQRILKFLDIQFDD